MEGPYERVQTSRGGERKRDSGKGQQTRSPSLKPSSGGTKKRGDTCTSGGKREQEAQSGSADTYKD